MKQRTTIAVTAVFVFILTGMLNPIRLPAADEEARPSRDGSSIISEGSSSNDLDQLMQGFDTAFEDRDPDKTGQPVTGDEEAGEAGETEDIRSGGKPLVFSLDGYFKLGSSYNVAHKKPAVGETDWRGLSRLRAELQLELNLKFSNHWQGLISGKGTYDVAYTLNGRSGYTDDVLDNYEKELELREAYVLGMLSDHLDIKLGRQIVVWGKSDMIRITDVLNPLDIREPGLTDLDDLRLPLAMTKLDYYYGDWNLSGISVHEIRFPKLPEFGSDFYPLPIPMPNEDKPSHGGGNTEYAVALSGTFSGWDIAFFWADIFWDFPYAELSGSLPNIKLELKYASVTMLGSAFNVAVGNWIFKAEAAHFDGLKYSIAPDKDYSRVDALLGFEYYGFDDMVIILEATNRHIIGFDDILKQPPDQAQKDEFQSVIRVSRTFFNETLELECLISFYGIDGEDGKFQRLSGEYDISDALKLLGGVLLYQSGDLAQFENIGDNDRLFLEFKYSF